MLAIGKSVSKIHHNDGLHGGKYTNHHRNEGCQGPRAGKEN